MLNSSVPYSEYEVAVCSVVREYGNLQRLNSQHELLTLIKDLDANRFSLTKEFLKRFDKRDGTHGLEHRINLLINYQESLRNAAIQENEILRKEEEKILRILNEKQK